MTDFRFLKRVNAGYNQVGCCITFFFVVYITMQSSSHTTCCWWWDWWIGKDWKHLWPNWGTMYMSGEPEKIHKKPHSNSQYPANTPRIHILNENESCNILRAVLMNIWVFWDVTSCQLVNSNWHLTGTCYFQKHWYLQFNMAHPIRLKISKG